ncbi:MerR family transcriptional regulator [Paenibacillus sp. GSMTC-2017]|uniref:MerR family transcriptional regulator n=1 Tax=Paenibacillus sp. GSMTC-2017 TaxID=2794350 RepID=UPI0018D7C498|nr:MerR family transcriptional regulator [Paenibacillus sp. GSMTC-2017]MBH5317857.1 MerR family transcriptional regulator [Paenibacillus sp. GSMTC-2017]
MNGLTISQVASMSHVNIETVRYYERRGLISKPPRSESGYRMFTQQAVEDIRFIKKAQEIGFTLEEIRSLLSLYKNEVEIIPADMQRIALEKIQEIEEKVNQLNRFKALLESAINRHVSKLPFSIDQCPVMKGCSEGKG